MVGAGEAVVEIRELGRADMDELLDWRMEVLDTVFEEDKPWDAEALRQANEAYYEHALGVSHVACVASVDGADAGCGAICLQEEMPSPDNPSGRCAYVMNVYTRPAFRHQGVAAQVIQWLIGRAQECGANKIYLEATAVAAPLYEELGFHPMEGMMKHRGGE